MLVVADTSPLNYLVWIESVEILPRLFEKVIMPLDRYPKAVSSRACSKRTAGARDWLRRTGSADNGHETLSVIYPTESVTFVASDPEAGWPGFILKAEGLSAASGPQV